ncbi:hypothetical protein HUT19_41315 (plasmid) [Streptomyces sp. NA02950]|uniref:hypothetical protein n=1 Tax=Streptomyces sp. NA02950 TaxID=2742137 RepID=UPI001590402A|nr:hypothetical protein [Streptomyces sp. NA02950]QKV98163.1 hypothetical protein HUT19_41315 [Streptomyces sp. NA02950]
MTSQVRRFTDYFVPLLMAVGGLIVGRVAFGYAAQQGANLYWQAGLAVLAYTLTVALLGRVGNDDPYEAVADATRALAYVIQAALAGALELLCLAVQLLAFIGGHLAPAPATT